MSGNCCYGESQLIRPARSYQTPALPTTTKTKHFTHIHHQQQQQSQLATSAYNRDRTLYLAKLRLCEFSYSLSHLLSYIHVFERQRRWLEVPNEGGAKGV